MRLLCELIIVAALIYAGWDKPFHEWLPGSQPPPVARPVTVATPIPKAPVTRQPAWMHDPNHGTALDTPHPAAAPASTAKTGSWMFDTSLAARSAGTRLGHSALDFSAISKGRGGNPVSGFKKPHWVLKPSLSVGVVLCEDGESTVSVKHYQSANRIDSVKAQFGTLFCLETILQLCRHHEGGNSWIRRENMFGNARRHACRNNLILRGGLEGGNLPRAKLKIRRFAWHQVGFPCQRLRR